jgi:hypothetical protein
MADDEIIINIGRHISRISKITIKFDTDEPESSIGSVSSQSIPYDSFLESSSEGSSEGSSYGTDESRGRSPPRLASSGSSSGSSSDDSSEDEHDYELPIQARCLACRTRVGQFIYWDPKTVTEVCHVGICIDTKDEDLPLPYTVIGIVTDGDQVKKYEYAICSKECLSNLQVQKQVLTDVCRKDVTRAAIMFVKDFKRAAIGQYIKNGWAHCGNVMCFMSVNEQILKENSLGIDIVKLSDLLADRDATLTDFRKKLTQSDIDSVILALTL